ncbi:MAG: hypothetical protein ER33_01530 [Cyanobium sp. CACIAM 14]|nr:MAG: hypothetical protein ER33_01530 [Cyanobium sp. CACIAM 14]
MTRPLRLLLGLASVLVPLSGRAEPPDRPDPPAPRIRHFDSDPQACRPEAIGAAYRSGLLPYTDQPPAVLARLRRVQDDMTLASLRRCVQKGLLPRSEASRLFRELGLTLPGTEIPPIANPQAPPPAATAPSTRP